MSTRVWPVLLLLLPSPAPGGARQEEAPALPPPPRPVVAILGASVTAGFVDLRGGLPALRRNRTLALRPALAKLWPPEQVDLRGYGNSLLFAAPEELAARQIEQARKAEPALVVALDLLFWFGYGHVPDLPGKEPVLRLERQRGGLALLEGFSCPMVIGDYPDMRGADPRMLSPRQVPSPEALAALNASLRRWAVDRKNVHLFPLSEFVRRSREEGEVLEEDGTRIEVPPRALLQDDRLHASRLGMVFLVHRLLPFLRDAAAEAGIPGPLAPGAAGLLDAFGARGDLEKAPDPGEEPRAGRPDKTPPLRRGGRRRAPRAPRRGPKRHRTPRKEPPAPSSQRTATDRI